MKGPSISDFTIRNKAIKFNKSDSIKAISAHESKDSKVSNLRTEYSDADNMKEVSHAFKKRQRSLVGYQ